MKYSLCIHSSPASEAGYSAYQFAKAALEQGYSIYRIFFYHEGAYQGTQLNCPPQGELDLVSEWRSLQQRYQLNITVCIAAALKRGILDETEATRYNKTSANLCPEFTLGGLGQLMEAIVESDRVMTFGG